MPTWTFISKNLAALQRRYRTNRAFSEVLTGIFPTVQVDRHWIDDTLDVYGLLCQAQSPDGGPNGALPELPACVLLAPPERDVLVHRVEFLVQAIDNVNDELDRTYHIFTPLLGYNPVANGAGFFFAWLQCKATATAATIQGQTVGIGGTFPTHQTVVFNGGPPITTFGPLAHTPRAYTSGAPTEGISVANNSSGHLGGFWTFQDPPLRLKPGMRLAVQQADTFLVSNRRTILTTNFYYSEREAQGGVG